MRIQRKSELKFFLSDFEYRDDIKIYVPPKREGFLASGFHYSDGVKTENYILGAVQKVKDVSDQSEELMREIKDWPSYYHLAMGRSNILKALNLPSGIRVLELGAGCGAITRYLGENFKEVDTVEGSLLRAEIIQERCRDLKNVRVFCSDIKNLKFESIYDVVTLIGVLEYAPLYLQNNSSKDGPDACLSLLKLAKSALKPGGVLVLAIENKIGLKYLSGCPDDHTGRLYEGIQGYPAEGGPVTFSRKEMLDLLKSAGFQQTSFYYCFPDYKFASVVFSDASQEENFYLHNWIDTPFKSYGPPRIHTFHEGLALRTLSQAGLLREFANSFLIVAGESSSWLLSQPDWVAKKFTTFNRRAEYRCVTTFKIKPEPYIEKIGPSQISSVVKKDSNAFEIRHRVANSPWHKGDLLVFEVYRAFFKKGFQRTIKELFKEYHRELLSRFDSGKKDKEGFPLLKGDSIDFIFRNIIRGEKGLIFIDPEWYIEDLLPADYVMYRCVLCDVVESSHLVVSNKISNSDKFAIELLKNFFPNYNKERHSKNMFLEKSFQDSVFLNSVGIEQIVATRKFPFLRKRIFWKMAKAIWDQLPTKLKRGIKRYLIEI